MEHKSSLATLCKLLLLPLLVVAGLAFSSTTVMASSYSYEKTRRCTAQELQAFHTVQGYNSDYSPFRCRRVYSKAQAKNGKVQTCWWTQTRMYVDIHNWWLPRLLGANKWTKWGTIGGGQPRGCKTN